ncbi:MAG TPA: hypothetical protein VHC69_01345 [Polyangiaceae bacterium]|nr:hypothetical protein [Polyangiaceae bacterium]
MNRPLVASFSPHLDGKVASLWLRRFAAPYGFRVVVSVALVLHFLRQAFEAFHADSSHRGLLALLCAFVSSLLVSSSILTPIAAIVVNITAVILYGSIPLVTLDDYFANLVPFAIATVWSAEFQALKQQRAIGLGCWIVSAIVLVIYVGGGPFALLVDSSRGPAWIRWAFRAIAVALVAPTAAVHGAAVLMQLVLHGYLFVTGPDKLVHVALGASAALFVNRRAYQDRVLRVDLWSVVALSLAFVTVNAYLGVRFFAMDVTRSARLLAAVGVLPIPSKSSATVEGTTEQIVQRRE